MSNRTPLALLCVAVLFAGCATRVDVEIQDTPAKRQPGSNVMRGGSGLNGSGQAQAPVFPAGPQFPTQPPVQMPPAEAPIVPSPTGGIPQVVAPVPADNRIRPGFEQTIYFDFDSFEVKPDYLSLIQRHANFFKTAGKASRVIIEGHTDVRGSAEYNLSLGQKRAEAVAQALRQNGVPAAVIDPLSFGKERPEAMGTTETDHARNRRATINYE